MIDVGMNLVTEKSGGIFFLDVVFFVSIYLMLHTYEIPL